MKNRILKLLFLLIYKLQSRYQFWYTFHQSQVEGEKALDSLHISHGKVTFYGKCIFRISNGSKITIGDDFTCQAGSFASIDCTPESKIQVEKNGTLIIGNNVGVSSIVLHCWNSIIIEDNVKIGAGCLIMDTNFHSTDATIRATKEDQKHVRTAPVLIKHDAFIGARSIICKGVTVGENSIIATGSVVVKDVPNNEVWGGNPAKFIKKI